jgi:hypothetical protein
MHKETRLKNRYWLVRDTLISVLSATGTEMFSGILLG